MMNFYPAVPSTFRSLFSSLRMRFIVMFAICTSLLFLMGGGEVSAQTAAQYTMNPSVGTYSPITGTNVTLTPTSTNFTADDEGAANGVLIGFPFNFAGTNYDRVNIGSNGFITLGNATNNNNITGTTWTNSFNAGAPIVYPLLAPLWDDLSTVTAGSNVSYSLGGSAPNRVFIIQYSGIKWNYISSANVISFQVILYEAPSGANFGRIDFVYNQGTANVNGGSASIGIASANGVYLSLNNSSNSPTASNTANTTNISTKPQTGQIYTFTPPASCTTVSNFSAQSVITLSSNSTICVNAGGSTNLSMSQGFTGVSYVWQQASSISGPWSACPNINNTPTYTATNITTTTWYKCVVTCTGNGAVLNTNPVQVIYDPTCIYMPSGTNVASVNACSGTFYDMGGSGDYANLQNSTLTINPSTPGSAVRVVFNSFNVETCCDNLKIYNGNSTAAPLISTYNSNPGTITSTAPDGSLTFVFYSDFSVVKSGWDATISCQSPCSGTPAPGPINATATSVCNGDATALSITNTNMGPGITYQWFASTSSPTSGFVPYSGTGANTATINPVINGLNWFYCVVTCTNSGISTTTSTVAISGTSCPAPVIMPRNTSATVTTCLGHFYDTGDSPGNYGDNENDTITFYPGTTGAYISLTFNSFQIETCCDNIKFYNGNSTGSPLLGTFTTNPGTITSTAADGSLTVVFHSDFSVNYSGWDATISCYTPPPCSAPLSPGNTVTTSSSLCVGASASLSLQYAIPGSGVTYLWQQGPSATGPWNPCSGINANPTYNVTGLTTTTWYQCKVICGGNSATAATSTPISITNDNSCINMPQSGAITTCNAGFYDSGGSTGNYSNREDRTFTINPATAGNFIRVTFNSFSLQSGFDTLYIYNGNSTAAPLLGAYSATSPGQVTSTAANGALTFVFHSNLTVVSSGWDATVTCYNPPQCNSTNTTPGNALANPNVLCSGEATNLSLSSNNIALGVTYQWQSSSTGTGGWTNIASATSPTFSTPALSATTWYQCVLYCQTQDFTATSVPVQVQVNASPTLNSYAGGSRCGVGTVNLTGAASSGAVVNWYSAASGGNLLGTGNTFTTPTINTNTTYYAAAFTTGISEAAGKSTPTATTNFITTNYGLEFDANRYLLLDSARIYPVGTGTVTIALQNAAGTELASTGAIAVSGSGSTTPVMVPLGFSVPVGSGYHLVVKDYTGITGLVRDNVASTLTYPYISPSNSLRVTGSWIGTSNTTAYYYFFYNLKIRTGCESGRRGVVATVTPPPAISLNSPAPVCSGSSTSLTASSANAGYTYTWTPGNLSGATVAVSPVNTSTSQNSVNVTYIVTGTDNVTGCVNVANVDVTVNALPSDLLISPVSAIVCSSPTITQLSVPGGAMPDGTWAAVTWSPVTDLYRDAAATSPYIAGQDNWLVYAKPLTSGTVVYTATATSPQGCTRTATSTLTVNNNTVSVSITANPSGASVCTGTPITFTATPTYSGTVPTLVIYQWYVNNIVQSGTSSTFTSSTLANGDQVKCVLNNNNYSCNPNQPATSNIITMSLLPSLATSVSFASPATIVCQNTPVTFNTTQINGGANPNYQFFVGNTSVQGPGLSSVLNYSFPNVGTFRVKVKMIPTDGACHSPIAAWDSTLSVRVDTTYNAAVVIASNVGTIICPGTTVTFTANATNGGPGASYQWQYSTDGGTSWSTVGTNSPSYTTNALANNSIVKCLLTSNISSCISPAATITSNQLTMSVQGQAFNITLTPSAQPSCEGDTVRYTATTNLSGTHSYQFFVNTIPVNNNNNPYYTYVPAAGDVVSVSVIPSSTQSCATPNPATASAAPQQTKPKPSVSISIIPGTCSPVGLTAVASTSAGTITNYQWAFFNGTTYQSIPASFGGTSQAYYTTTNNTFQVTVTNTGGCSTTSVPSPSTNANQYDLALSGVYTIGAVAATGANATASTTVTCNSTAGLVAGREIAVTSPLATGSVPAGTVVQSITNPTQFVTNNAVTLNNAVITQASCSNFISYTKAVDALNKRSISGNVVFNASADFNEYLTGRLDLGSDTLPSTRNGFNTTPALNTQSATNSITFRKTGTGANPLLWAYTNGAGTTYSSTPDGMWALNGIDYVTIDSVDLKDNNATNYMEYGFGLFRFKSDGAQNNTIKNCNITLNKNNNVENLVANAPNNTMPNGSTGILVNSGTVTTANTLPTTGSASASNSFNKFYSNTIQNCYNGIVLTGYASPTASTTQADGDYGNDVGGSNISTGNIIKNFAGTGTAEAYGIKATAQWNLNVSYNTIDNSLGGTAATGLIHGIRGVSGDRANLTINANTIKLLSSSTLSEAYGINNAIGGNSTATTSNTINIINNNISGSSSSTLFGAINNSATCVNININGNNIIGFNYTGSGEFRGIYNGGNSNTLFISNNTIKSNTVTTANEKPYSLISAGATTLGTNALSTISNNNLISNSKVISTVTAAATPYFINTGLSTKTIIASNYINDNSFNITAGTTFAFTLSGIYSSGGNIVVSNNKCSKNYANINGGTNIPLNLYGYNSTSTTNDSIFNNTFSNFYINSSNSPVTASNILHNIVAIRAISSAGTTKNIFNNIIDSIYTNTEYTCKIMGIYTSTGSSTIFKNKISRIFPGKGATSQAYGISQGGASNLNVNINNNMISIDFSLAFAPAGANVVNNLDAIRGIDIGSTNATSNINVYHNSIYIKGTNATAFGSTAIQHLASATSSTTTQLDLRNNILVNESTPVGTGAIVAGLKRSAASALANYSTNSNNNDFYVPNGALYVEGITAYTTLAALTSNLGPTRENASKNVQPSFVNNAYDLHMLCGVTGISNAGTYVASVPDDIDADVRSNGLAPTNGPDIGADEFNLGSFAGRVLPDTTVCQGASGTLNLVGASGTVVNWRYTNDNGLTWRDTAITANSINYTNIQTTSKYIALVNSSACGGSQYSDTATVTVNPKPTLTSASTSLCVGGTLSITPSTLPALASPWVSNTPSLATVSGTTTGTVTGIAAGTPIRITFTSNQGCSNYVDVTVNAQPAAPAVTGAARCGGPGSPASVPLTATPGPGETIDWYSAPTGGTLLQANSNTYTPTISVTTVYYVQAKNASGCTSPTRTPVTATINAFPSVTGGSVCVGATLNLSPGATAGTGTNTPVWSSVTPATAAVNSNGQVLGVAAGPVTINYTNTDGCSTTAAVTVNANPTVTYNSTAVGNSLSICEGAANSITLTGSGTNAALTSSTPWLSTNTTVASVVNAASTTTTLTGLTAGTGSITYTATGGCYKTFIVTVNPLPTRYNLTVTGNGAYCAGGSGQSIGLSNSQVGVTYNLYLNPSATILATVSGTGFPISFGNFIPVGSYYVRAQNATTNCAVSMLDSAKIKTYALPVISGGLTICPNGTTQLTADSAAAPFTWVSSNPSVATINATGLVTGVTAGPTTITYTDRNGCTKTAIVTVNAASVGGTVSSNASVCGTATGTVSLTGNTGNVSGWYSSTNAGPWTLIASTSGLTSYAYTVAAPNKVRYRAYVQNGGCTPDSSSYVTISANATPTNFTVTGGGSFCAGGSGIHIGLSGSQIGVSYQLVQNAVTNFGSAVQGTGAALDFGVIDEAGTYTVIATNASFCLTTTTNSVTVTIKPLPTINITQTSPIAVCDPSTVTLNATTNGTSPIYQWYLDSDPIDGANSSAYTIGGVGTGVYTVFAISNGCSSPRSKGVVVTINTKPSSVSVTPSSSSLCLGSNTILRAGSDSVVGPDIALYENFNDATTNWTESHSSTSPSGSNWALRTSPFTKTTGYPTFDKFSTVDGGKFVMADADDGGAASHTNTILTSPSFNLSNYNSATLSFEHSLWSDINYDDLVEVDISINGGTSWTTLQDYWGSTAGSHIDNGVTTENASIDLQDYVGNSNVKVRFVYSSYDGYYWLIDNIKVSGIKRYPTTYAWTPLASGLNTYTGDEVVAAPTVNTTYTLTASTTAGCTATATAQVTIQNKVTVTTDPLSGNICTGGTMPTLSVAATGAIQTYQWYVHTSTQDSLIVGAINPTFTPNMPSTDTTLYFVIVDGPCGADSSNYAVWVVKPGAHITTEPVAPASSICIGGTSPSLTVTADGAISYQWYSNVSNSNSGGAPLSGATSATFAAPVSAASTLYYYVVVNGTCGKDTSVAVPVSVIGNTSITAQPVAPATAVCQNELSTLSVSATGGNLTYQWYSNSVNSNTGGTPLSGSTSSTLTIPTATTGTTYYYTIVSGCTPINSNAVAVTVNAGGSWIGSNTNWEDANNWCGGIPTGSTNVTIPVSSFYPVITTNTPVCRNITIATGASITVNGKLAIAGTISNSGTFNAKNGTIELNGSSAQTIPANAFQNNNLRNLIINNSSVTLGGTMNLLGKLSFARANATFAAGDSLLHLKSSDTLTAIIADVTNDSTTLGNQITGNVVAERYLSQRKAWRFLSMPTQHNAQTIKQAWQEGAGLPNQNTRPGYGTQLVGYGTLAQLSTVTGALGFDTVSTTGASIKTYNPVNNAWDTVGSTNSYFKPGKAYMTFVRGSRAKTRFNDIVDSTVLREKGSLNVGNISFNNLGTANGQFVGIGNPYASPVDFRRLLKSNLADQLYLWDPYLSNNLGAWQVVTFGSNGSFNISPGGGSFPDPNFGTITSEMLGIPSGAGFIVSTNGGVGSITFTEPSKIDSSRLHNREINLSNGTLRTSLYALNSTSNQMVDGTLHYFATDANNAIDQEDAKKLSNLNENFSIKDQGVLLSMNRRSDLTVNDTLYYHVKQFRSTNYQLLFKFTDVPHDGLQAILQDKYNNQEINLNMDGLTTYNFSVISSNPVTFDSARFRIVFKPLTPVPVSFTDIKAEKQQRNALVTWKVENETNIDHYIVEESVDGRNFVTLGSQAASGINTYSMLDRITKSGNNYYRVYAVEVSGARNYSRIARVTFDNIPVATLYPNPVKADKKVGLQMTDMASGEYQLKIYNSLGQRLMTTIIDHDGANRRYEIKLDKVTTHGNYHAELTNANDVKIVLKFIF